MFQTGSTINPALGRTDYSAYAQGAIAGGQAIGQGIANLGQSIASGIEAYTKKKEAKKELETAISGFTTLADRNSKAAEQLGLTPELRKDPKAIASVVKSLGGPAVANSLLFQLAQQQQQLDLTQSTENRKTNVANDAFKYMQTGEMPVGTNGVLDPRYKAEVERTAYQMRMGRNTSILNQAQIAAEIAKIRAQALDIRAQASNIPLGGYETAEEAQVVSNILAKLSGDNFIARVEQNPKDRKYTAGTVLKPQPVVPDKYRDMAAQTRFENDKATVDSAQNAINEIQINNNIISLIDSGQVSTGISAPVQVAVDKSFAFFGGEAAAKRASETEILDSLLGRSFLDERARANITSTMMNTKAELELYRGIFSGTKTLEPESIKKIAQLKTKIAEGVIDSHNRRIGDGSLDQYYNSIFGRNGTFIKIPEYVKPPTASDKPTRIPTASQLTQTPQVTPAPQAPQAPSFAVTTIGGKQLPMITKRAIRLQPQAASLPNSPLMKTYNESAPASEFSIDNLTRKFSLNR